VSVYSESVSENTAATPAHTAAVAGNATAHMIVRSGATRLTAPVCGSPHEIGVKFRYPMNERGNAMQRSVLTLPS
jgi:hypothetical protein